MADDLFNTSDHPGTILSLGFAVGSLALLIAKNFLTGNIYSGKSHQDWMVEKDKQLTEKSARISELELEARTKDLAYEKMRDERDGYRRSADRANDQLAFELRQRYPNLPPPPAPPQLPGGGS